jgi:deoxyribonuclease V
MDRLCSAKFSIEKARRAQSCLAKKVIREDRLSKKIRLVAGVDAAYSDEISIGTTAVVDYQSGEVIEIQTAKTTIKFPYIPTLFSFRELPPIIASIRKLNLKPDVFIVDGHGLAHPFLCGLASHLGVVLDIPTIGAAKKKLSGDVIQQGSSLFLMQTGEIVGAVVNTKMGCKPIYVSIGHMVSLDRAVDIVKHLSKKDRLPEPVQVAHRIATQKRKIELSKSEETENTFPHTFSTS